MSRQWLGDSLLIIFALVLCSTGNPATTLCEWMPRHRSLVNFSMSSVAVSTRLSILLLSSSRTKSLDHAADLSKKSNWDCCVCAGKTPRQQNSYLFGQWLEERSWWLQSLAHFTTALLLTWPMKICFCEWSSCSLVILQPLTLFFDCLYYYHYSIAYYLNYTSDPVT